MYRYLIFTHPLLQIVNQIINKQQKYSVSLYIGVIFMHSCNHRKLIHKSSFYAIVIYEHNYYSVNIYFDKDQRQFNYSKNC